MRTDIFAIHKSVHIKLNKEVHFAFKVKMLEMGLSLQEVFNEFARQVVNEDKKATALLNRYIKKKLQKQIDGLNNSTTRSELDADTIYDLIHSSDDSENDDDDEDELDI